MGKQSKDSAYVHVSDLSLTIIMLSYMLKLSHPDKIQNTYVFIHRITYVHARLHVIYVDYFGCLVGWYYYVCNFNKCEIMVYNINALTYGKHLRTIFSYVTQENWFIPSDEGTNCK